MMSTPRLLTRSTLAVLVVVATVAPTCLSQLNGKCAHTTRTRVDENLLSLFQIRSFDQRLPGGQADQGDGSRFFHGECFGLDRHVILFDRTEFRECTDSPVSRARIDFVAGLESTHSRSDPDHDPGDVMAQNERQAIRQNALELAVSDFGIQKVDTSGVNLDQDVILAQLRVWHVASPHTIGASVTIEDECLHRRSACESQATAGTPATCRSSAFGSAKKAGPVP